MRRRIYLLSTALTLAMVNLMMLPITANSVVLTASQPPQSIEGCGCGKDSTQMYKQVVTQRKLISYSPLRTVDCRGCTKTYNYPDDTWCIASLPCATNPPTYRKLVRNKCWYNCGDGNTYVACGSWTPTNLCCAQGRYTEPPCEKSGEILCEIVTPGSCP